MLLWWYRKCSLPRCPLTSTFAKRQDKQRYILTNSNNWRGILRNVGLSLIVEELLKTCVLDMTPDVIRTDYIVISPFTKTLDVRASSEVGKLKESREWMAWFTGGSRIVSKYGLRLCSSSPRTFGAESLGPYCTIFQEEFSGTLARARRGPEEFLGNRNILILFVRQSRS